MPMRPNTVKARLAAGETAIGVFISMPAPTLAEVFGTLGFDFGVIDAEHAPFEPASCEHMIRAADAVNFPIFIRIAMNHPQNILRYLDIGALGVQIPMVNTGAEAREVVDAVKYPPVGKRGLAGVRAANYGLTGPLGEYVQVANRETLTVVQVETLEAAENLDDLIAPPEIDVVFIGPNDLSSSMGFPGQGNHPEVQALIADLAAKIQAAGKVAGTIAYDFAALKRTRELGFRYILAGTVPLLATASRAYLAEARRPLGD